MRATFTRNVNTSARKMKPSSCQTINHATFPRDHSQVRAPWSIRPRLQRSQLVRQVKEFAKTEHVSHRRRMTLQMSRIIRGLSKRIERSGGGVLRSASTVPGYFSQRFHSSEEGTTASFPLPLNRHCSRMSVFLTSVQIIPLLTISRCSGTQ